ncbi:hypothetical protein [Mammaliicoccus sciuri]|uniref:hypothetical protein n=1 Tax=Mammaliicoccus sciuri TaxID=1296 RepID=UPI001FB1D8CE|nr:hypothetical protein [Mammaliicoccus sciuri]MCJ1776315.1 hypothetical protein [Mammaliicoccus sciuri]
MKKYIKLIVIFTILVIVIAKYAINYDYPENSQTFFDESIISFLAFLILAITTMMQSYELKLQREDIKNSNDAQIKQSEELYNSNTLTKESVYQSRYFELLRLKEEITNKINVNLFSDKIATYIKMVSVDTINGLSKKEAIEFGDFIYTYCDVTEDEMRLAQNIQDFDEKQGEKTEIIEILPSLKFSFEWFNNLLNNRESMRTYFDDTYPDEILNKYEKVFSSIVEKNKNKNHEIIVFMLDERLEKLHNIQKVIIELLSDIDTDKSNLMSLSNMHKSLLSKDEDMVYKIIDNGLTFDEIIEIERSKHKSI